MENIVFGAVTVGICLIGYFTSWKYFKKGNFKAALMLIILCGILIYTFTAADFYLHFWDERYHALVAKNLIKHPLIPTLYENPVLPYDYKMWVGNHVWLHKQPMALWIMAGSMKLFGINEIALRLPSIVFAAIGILLIYKVGTYFFSKQVGLLASFFFSINGLILELVGGRVATDHIDIAFMFFILLAIYFITLYVKQKNFLFTFLIGLCIGAALLTKWLAGLIVLPIWLILIIGSNSFSRRSVILNFSFLLLVVALVALPWQIYIFSEFPLEATHESDFNLRHFTEVIEGQYGSIFYFINRIRINYGELIYLPLVWILWSYLKRPGNSKYLAIIIWVIAPLVIFSLAKTKMQGYLLISAPALFLVTAAFFFELLNHKAKFKSKLLFYSFLALFILLPIRYSIERMKPFEKRDRSPQWVSKLKALNKKSIQKGVLFNYNNPIEAMFYTNLIAYSEIPTPNQIQELIAEGYLVIINEGDVPYKIERIEGITWVILQSSMHN